ncbi:MAG: efflux RND transporter permease subunit [Bacillota bacterium]
MSLPKLSVNRPIGITMLILIILMLGFVSFTNLSIDLFPELKFPIAVVYTEYPGAGPGEVENLISRPLEQMVGSVRGLKGMESHSSVGSSIVLVEFGWGVDMNQATIDLKEQIDLMKGYLPAEAKNPLVIKMDPNVLPIMQLVATGDLPLKDLKTILEDKVIPRFERIEGVASITLSGGETREIRIEVDPAKLSYYGLTLPQLLQAFQGDNLNLSGGVADMGGQEILLQIRGEYQNLEELSNVSLMTPLGTTVRLKDLGRVVDGFQETDKISRLNGLDSIGLDIRKQTDANTVKVSKEIREAAKELQAELFGKVNLTTLWDQADYIEWTIKNMTISMLQGALLALLILYLFLRNFRTTLVIAISMPISIIATFTMVYFGGISLNLMSLGGLALGVGMMVDNSIVILENIFRHRELGIENKEAAIAGANEVTSAITASTLTTIAVFFPIVFVDGIGSQLFRELALTVSFSLAASLLVALTLVPMLSSKLLKIIPVDSNGVSNGAKLDKSSKRYWLMAKWGQLLQKIDDSYEKLLVLSLKKRGRVVLLVGFLVLVSAGIAYLVGAEFIPAMDEGSAQISIALPHGSKLEETEKVAQRVEAILADIPEIETVFTSIGSGGGGLTSAMGGGSTRMADIDIMMTGLKDRKRKAWDVADEIRLKTNDIAGAEINVSAGDAVGSMGFSMSGLLVRVEGDDLEVLREIAAQVKELVVSVEGTREVEITGESGRPELLILVNRDKAASYGLSQAQIVSTIRTAMQGQTVTRFRDAGEEVDVKVIFPKDSRMTVSDLKSIEMLTPLGFKVALNEVADFEMVQGPTDISRKDQVRYVSISSQLVDRDLNSAIKDIQALLDKQLSLPDGYRVSLTGAAEEMNKAFGSLTNTLIMAIFLVYMIMAAQFESLLHPFIIMFSMPVTIIGVVLGLVLTGSTLNVISFIGIVMLAGIVVNNGIVLVDYINILRSRGMETTKAIIEGGKTRLRPILMTALTTILAMLPLMFASGEGSEAGGPLASVIVGGLTTSTFLTLILVPVIYSIFEDWAEKLKAKKLKAKS